MIAKINTQPIKLCYIATELHTVYTPKHPRTSRGIYTRELIRNVGIFASEFSNFGHGVSSR